MADIFSTKPGDRKIQDVLWYPHLPVREDLKPHWLCLPKKLIRSYTERDLRQIGHSVRDRLECQLQESKHDKRIEHKTLRKIKRIQKELKEDSNMRLCDLPYDPDADKKAEWSLKRLKKSIKGKSADVISSILLKDALEQQSTTQQENYNVNEEFHTMRGSRRQMHVSMMEEMDTRHLEESLTEPLGRLKGELRGFGKKENIYLENKRLDFSSACVPKNIEMSFIFVE